VAFDSSGNVLFAATTYLGDVDGHTNAGGKDIVLFKYDANGQKLWSRQFGLASSESAGAVATDASGNVYVGGSINGDALILKYDGDGSLQWSRQADLGESDYVAALRADSSGNLFVGATKVTIQPSGPSTYESAVLEYDSAGKAVAQSLEPPLGVFDSSGNRYTLQNIQGSIDGATNAGGYDVVLTKYNALGQKLWARQDGGDQNDTGHAVAIDPSGNIYVAGSTTGGIDGYPDNTWRFTDAFILKYDANGNEI